MVKQVCVHPLLSRRCGLFFVLLIAVLTSSRSQLLPIQTYTTKDGLLSNVVNTFCQDSRGFLWIGTDLGISVFDGSVFRNYTVADGLTSGIINAFEENRHVPDAMWIGTDGGGLIQFVQGKIIHYRIGTTGRTNGVNSVTEDSRGNVWCGTDDGVFIESNGKITEFHPGMHLGYTSRIKEGPPGTYWIFTGKTVYRYTIADEKIIPMKRMGHLLGNPSLIDNDPDGNLWVLTGDSSIVEIRGDKAESRYHFLEGLPSGLFEDNDGNLWEATPGALFKFPKSHIPSQNFIRYTTENRLLTNNVPPGFQDREGNLWFGSFGKGMQRLPARYGSTIPVSEQTGRGVADEHQHLWLLVAHGVWEIWADETTVWHKSFHPVAEAMGEKTALDISYSASRLLWIRFNDGSFISYRIQPAPEEASRLSKEQRIDTRGKLPSAGSLAFLIDSHRYLWYSIDTGGVAVVDIANRNLRVRIFSERDGVPDKGVRVISEDSRGNIWFGGRERGISMLKQSEIWTGKPTQFSAGDGAPVQGVRSIFEDSRKTIWVGTHYGGLAAFRGGKFIAYSIRDGIPSDIIFALAEGKDSTLWLGTQAGMAYHHGADSLRFYRSTEFPDEPVYSCGVMDNGTVWALMRNSLTLLPAVDSPRQLLAPRVYITGIEVNGSQREIQGEISLPYDNNSCRIEFSGISLSAGPLLRYHYKLEGAENGWHALASGRSVTYASLEPGSYTFLVRAEGPGGLESPQPATIHMTIVPPFWRTWWFIALAIVFFNTVVYGIMRYRLLHVLKIEKMRGGIATDLHDDIGSSLTQIALLSDAAAREARREETHREAAGSGPGKTIPMLSEIGATSRELINAMNDIVWSVNPKNDSFDEITLRMKDHTARVMEAAGIDFQFEMSSDLSRLVLPLDFRRNIYLLFKEALNNVAKHSGARIVHVVFSEDGGRLVMTVRDDGVGFDPVASSKGNGLTNMRKRAELLGATLAFDSHLAQGTTIIVRCPIP